MKVRRQGGATLGLVAACVFFVIVIGVGFYFLSKIIGGGREVANATDAGALNVARQALKRGTVTLNVAQNAEFGALTDPPGSGIVTLITYNRIIAQAMMVAQNAQVENTPLAKTNAMATAALAQSVGAALKTSLNSAAAGSLPGDFNAIAGISNTKMWNGNTVSCTTITTGYLKPKGSTNVIFDSNTIATLGAIPASAPALGNDLMSGISSTNKTNSTDSLGASVASSAHYMPGYDSNTFLGGAVSLTGVPVFPNTKPHLVDIGTFNTDIAANSAFVTDPNTSANSFRSNAQAIESKSSNMAGTLACAVVGVLNKDFKASFPRGFVKISNGPDALSQIANFGVPISDGTNDIFNNQLYTGPGAAPGASGLYQDNSGCFSTNPGDLQAWAAFNNRTGLYNSVSPTNTNYTQNLAVATSAGVTGPCWVGYGLNAAGTAYPPNIFVPQQDLPSFADPAIVGPSPESLYDMAQNPGPVNVGYDAGQGGIRWGSPTSQNTSCNLFATITQLEQIGGGQFNCNYTMYDAGLTGPCADTNNINNWQQNYGCISSLPTNSGLALTGNNQGVTNVEYLKAELLTKIAGRLGGHFCADVDIPSTQPSGIKYFSQGVPGTTSGYVGSSVVAFDPGRAGASPVVNFEVVNSPYMYLTQITNPANNGLSSNLGSCANGSSQAIIEQIVGRMQQIESSVTQTQVTNALKSQPLHLKSSTGAATPDNGTLYLYVDPTTHQPAMNAQLPAGWTDSTSGSPNFPDGAAPSVNAGECYDQYPLNGWVVNTQYQMTGTGKGDANYHDQPFTQPTDAPPGVSYNAPSMMSDSQNLGGSPGPAIYGQDQAIFKTSSGAQNNLGVLNFQENTQGTTFCKPN